MSKTWYYVLDGERKGPVEKSQILLFIKDKKLKGDDYVWSKGMDNWIRIKEVKELQEQASPLKEKGHITLNLTHLSENEKKLYIKIGMDRAMANEVEYGPFTLNDLKKLFIEKRINPKTFIFMQGMPDWQPLSTVEGYEEVFNEAPPLVKSNEKRNSKRKPLIARMFIQSRQDIFEGICRDISIGGMQVLVDGFPGEAGEKININVHPENTEHHFVARGEIVRLLDGNQGFSFRFLKLEDDAVNAISKYLAGN